MFNGNCKSRSAMFNSYIVYGKVTASYVPFMQILNEKELSAMLNVCNAHGKVTIGYGCFCNVLWIVKIRYARFTGFSMESIDQICSMYGIPNEK